MKIVIVGAGEVGAHLGETLSLEGHDVTIIDRDDEKAQSLNERIDARVIQDNGSSASVLKRAGTAKCDFFLAVTSSDETNLVSASLAKAIGARITFARAHDSTYRDSSIINHQSLFGIDHLVNPEALAAVEMAARIRNPGRVAVEDFGRGKIEVLSLEVQPKAKVIGQPLSTLKLSSQIRIGLINRGEEAFVANANSVLQPGDNVTLFGDPQALFESYSMFDPQSKGGAKTCVAILSGSEIAIALSGLLSHSHFRIRIIEKDLERCRALAERLPNVNIIHGDGTSLRVLEEEEVGTADFFVACSKDDEENIMTCLQASKLGAEKTMLAINRADYIDVLDKVKDSLGVHFAVSPRVTAAKEVLRYLGDKPFVEIESGNSSSSIIELTVKKGAKVTGKRIRDIPLPDECVLVGHERNYEPKMPTGDDMLQEGDLVLAIISKSKIKELLRLTR